MAQKDGKKVLKVTGDILISTERQRQILKEGYTDKHDDLFKDGELAWAAVCYAAPKERLVGVYHLGGWVDPWPWHPKFDKRGQHNRVRELQIAGALIAAEIDRLLRTRER